MPRILIFGLLYSPNLGDGIIAECLAAGLRQERPDLDVVHVDISGRQAFGDVVVTNRATILRVMNRLPRTVRHSLVRYKLGKILDEYEPLWRDEIHKADLCVIGGGQIFSDADLNFCLKIGRVARLLHAADRPAVVHAAGVARNWSPEGTRLFARLTECDLRAVGLRDEGSIQAWRDQFGNLGPAPRLTRDPGLLAEACYGPPPQLPKGIGLCITDPTILRYHADTSTGAAINTSLFAQIALKLGDIGPKVTLFCNGAAEDQAAAQAVLEDPALQRMRQTDRIRIANMPQNPAQLAHLVAGFQGVVAHRLHACILAFAYRRPVVGMGWDTKLQSFFASVGLENSFLGATEISPETVGQAMRATMEAGPDLKMHAEVLAQTRQQVALILDELP